MTSKSDFDEVFSGIRLGSRIVIWFFGLGFIWLVAHKVDKSWDEIKELKEKVERLEMRNGI